MTTRERLARALHRYAAQIQADSGCPPFPPFEHDRAGFYEGSVDAILDELMEPSEEALRRGQMEMPAEADYWMKNRILHCEPRPLHKCVPPKNVWQAILTHIKAGK